MAKPDIDKSIKQLDPLSNNKDVSAAYAKSIIAQIIQIEEEIRENSFKKIKASDNNSSDKSLENMLEAEVMKRISEEGFSIVSNGSSLFEKLKNPLSGSRFIDGIIYHIIYEAADNLLKEYNQGKGIDEKKIINDSLKEFKPYIKLGQLIGLKGLLSGVTRLTNFFTSAIELKIINKNDFKGEGDFNKETYLFSYSSRREFNDKMRDFLGSEWHNQVEEKYAHFTREFTKRIPSVRYNDDNQVGKDVFNQMICIVDSEGKRNYQWAIDFSNVKMSPKTFAAGLYELLRLKKGTRGALSDYKTKVEQYETRKEHALGEIQVIRERISEITEADSRLQEIESSKAYLELNRAERSIRRMSPPELSLVRSDLERIMERIKISLLRKSPDEIIRISEDIESKYRELAEMNDELDELAYSLENPDKKAVTIFIKGCSELKQKDAQLIRALAKSLDHKKDRTERHPSRTGRFLPMFVRSCQYLALDKKYPYLKGTLKLDINEVIYAGEFHDIGKLGIPDSILLKNGSLNKGEFMIIQSHSKIGAEILDAMGQGPDTLYYQAALFHHERYDGARGYPQGIKKDEIPLIARLMSYIDAFDAIAGPRIYDTKRDWIDGLNEINRCNGTQFDSRYYDPFFSLFTINLLKHINIPWGDKEDPDSSCKPVIEDLRKIYAKKDYIFNEQFSPRNFIDEKENYQVTIIPQKESVNLKKGLQRTKKNDIIISAFNPVWYLYFADKRGLPLDGIGPVLIDIISKDYKERGYTF